MMLSRTLSLIALICFLPVATGCSTVRSVPIPDDPGSEDDPLQTEEPLAVTGYVDVWGTDHDWNGFVQVVGADSLEFTRPARAEGNAPPSGDPEPVSLRLARDEIPAVLVQQRQTARTRLLAGAIFLGVVAIVAIGLANWDLDMDFGGGYNGG